MKKYKLGKLPAIEDKQGRTLMMSTYMKNLPDPPESFDNYQLIEDKLKIKSVQKLQPMMNNNKIGCCAIAALGHKQTVDNGRIGDIIIASDQYIKDFYFNLSGGKDTGLYLLNVLKYVRKNPFNGDKIIAFGKINHLDHKEVKQAIWLFGPLYIGFSVQPDAINDFDNNHKIWTPGDLSQSEGGHCVIEGKYDNSEITSSTWGDIQPGTWDWHDKRIDESYAFITDEIFKPGFCDEFDKDQLIYDFQQVTGERLKIK